MTHGIRMALGLALAMALAPRAAEAGFLDKLNEATKKLEQKNQQMQQQQQTSGGGGGSLSAGLGATQLDGLDIYTKCTDQAANVHDRLQAQVLRRRLRTNPGSFTAQQRKETEEDVVWLDTPTPAQRKPHPKPQRWLMVMTDDEQVEVNSTAGRYIEEVRQKCDAKYGGMSNFSNAAGAARRAAVNATVPFPDLEHSAPMPPAPKPRTAMDDMQDCMMQGQNLRWQVTADVMQAKMDKLNPSGADRKAWEEDIALIRNFSPAAGKMAMPQSPDPKNPTRWMMRLDMNEQMAVNTQYASANQAHLEKCQAPGNAAEKSRIRAQGEELAKKAKQEAAANKAAAKERAERDAKAAADRAQRGGGGSLSAGLGATDLRYMQEHVKCYDPMKGHLAKVTAEMLEKKLKAAKNLDAQKRSQWEADIAAWREAEANGADTAVPPDLDNPYRWQDWLSKGERQEINSQHAKFSNQIQQECTGKAHMQ